MAANGVKRAFLAAASILLVLVVILPAAAAPLQQEPRPVIAQPEDNSAVRGVVQIIGTAVHPEFQRYELYYAPWPTPSDQSWVFIGDAKYQQQPLGLLGTWDTRAVPDGAYALRVRVVRQDGNYLDSDPTRVLVTNTRPIAEPSPTPTDTVTPETEPIITEPTAVTEVVAPTIEVLLPTEEPTRTPEPEAVETPEAAPTEQAADVTGPTDDEGFSTSRIIEVARKSAMYTAGFFLALGAFFAVKAALVWTWHRIRP